MITEEAKRKGREAETNFQKWLDSHKLPFWYIKQDPETYSGTLRELRISRPDYMILLYGIGLMLVDVKHRYLDPQYSGFLINYARTQRYWRLLSFGLPVWYVFSNQENYQYKKWFWISVAEAVKVGIKTRAWDKDFLRIPVGQCIEVEHTKSIDKVVSGYPERLNFEVK